MNDNLMIVDENKIEAMNASLARDGWGTGVSPNMRRLVARIAVLYQLDVLLDEVVILGGNKIYIATKGALRKAHASGQLDGIGGWERIREEGDADGVYRFKVSIWIKGCSRPFEEMGKAGGPDERNPVGKAHAETLARTRALGRCLRLACGISLPLLEDADDYSMPHSRNAKSGLAALAGVTKPEPVEPPPGMERVEAPSPVETDFQEVEVEVAAAPDLEADQREQVKRTELAEVLKLKWRETGSTKAQVIAALRGAAARSGASLGEIPMKGGKMDIAAIPSIVLAACLNEVA